MKSNDYVNLEKDYGFKRFYLSKTPWWKNTIMVPPILLLFTGLAGILYLFHYDKLVSLYIIPYLILFVVGTILLKSIKRHILKKAMTVPESFHVCLAASIGEKDGYIYSIFVNNNRRHDKYYITNLAKDMSLHDLLEQNGNVSFKTKAGLIHDPARDIDIYVRAYQKKEVTKQNAGWSLNEGYFPVLYIDDKYVPVIKRRDLTGGKK